MNFSISDTLPNPIGYKNTNQNPILICITDQLKQDTKWSIKYKTAPDLLDGIITALNKKEISWPRKIKKYKSLPNVRKEYWIKKMENNCSFYKNESKTVVDDQAYENLLMDLAAHHLERRIILKPFFQEEKDSEFGSKTNGAISYHLLYCNTMQRENFYCSINPKVGNITKKSIFKNL